MRKIPASIDTADYPRSVTLTIDKKKTATQHKPANIIHTVLKKKRNFPDRIQTSKVKACSSANP